MRKFGTGTAQKIWAWWDDFHNKNVRNKGFGGFLAGIFPFIIALIGVIIVGIFDAIFAFFDLLNSKEDDDARDFVNRRSCGEINALSDDLIVDLIRKMQDGPTLDEDENAILKLLSCLPCPRLHTIVNRIGRGSLESDLDGEEYDRLRVLFGNCGIIRFSDWDDDATRIFINSATCESLNALSLDNIKALIDNLFSGSTGDDDEAAIVKLINCLQPETVQNLVRQPGFSVDDFDDEVDGSEWTQLRQVFRNKGVSA